MHRFLPFFFFTIVAGYPISQLLLTGTMPPLSKADMILQDMQTHYEDLVDQVLSTHSEDVLLALIKKPQVLLETPSVKGSIPLFFLVHAAELIFETPKK
jgi:hypothetical protein